MGKLIRATRKIRKPVARKVAKPSLKGCRADATSKGKSVRAVRREVVIKDERSLFRCLEAAVRDELEMQNVLLSFENWPFLSIRLEGNGYDATITPDMAEALVALQKALNRTYARVVHNAGNAKHLHALERQRLRFKARVQKGSSLIEINLGEYAKELFQSVVGKMDGKLAVVTVLGVAAIVASGVAYKDFLQHRSQDKAMSEETRARVALSQEETRRMQILAQAMSAAPALKPTTDDFNEVRQDILKGVADAKTISVQRIQMSKDEAVKIAATPRSVARPVQLNGSYIVHKLDWQKPDEVRLWLHNVDTKREFVATLTADAITPEQRELLKSAEWDRRTVHMSINATELRGEVTTAAIVGVEWPTTTGSLAQQESADTPAE